MTAPNCRVHRVEYDDAMSRLRPFFCAIIFTGTTLSRYQIMVLSHSLPELNNLQRQKGKRAKGQNSRHSPGAALLYHKVLTALTDEGVALLALAMHAKR